MPSHPAPPSGPRPRGTLFVVATPIGNLEDITIRALRILKAVDLIAAEDTRHTAHLLHHYGISTPMLSLHEHNEAARIDTVMARLADGQSVALVSDAGTPLISDPGAALVAAARAADVRVEALPGASALLVALVASGMADGEFTFLGFPPKKKQERAAWLRRAAAEPRTLIIYEAPHRIRESLADMAEAFGLRPAVLARELTKIHEEFRRGTCRELLEYVESPKGEYVVIIGADRATDADNAPGPLSKELVYTEFCRMTELEGFARREAVAALARRFATPAREIYSLVELAKHQDQQ